MTRQKPYHLLSVVDRRRTHPRERQKDRVAVFGLLLFLALFALVGTDEFNVAQLEKSHQQP